MNIFLKSKNFLFSFKLPKAKSLLNSFNLVYTYQYKFSEKISRKKCSHLKSDFYNLLLVSKKSEENILNTIEKYPDINYICFLMQMVLELQFATPYLVEPLTTKFLQVELNNPTNLMNLYRGLLN